MSLKLIYATNPQIMSICYIAIEPNGFNYYINTFVDVPVNYASSLVKMLKCSQIFQQNQRTSSITVRPSTIRTRPQPTQLLAREAPTIPLKLPLADTE